LCWKTGIPWLGLLHDWSKFLPSEFFTYAQQFHNGGDLNFNTAQLLHHHRNKHHWQWWILVTDKGEEIVLPMPDKYRREMLCDWKAALCIQHPKMTIRDWYAVHEQDMCLHPQTRKWLNRELGFRNTEYVVCSTTALGRAGLIVADDGKVYISR